MKMRYRKMRNIEWEVSALGFGAMRLPTLEVEKEGEKKTIIDEKLSIEMIRYAIDHGCTYVDTAWMYMNGKSEELVGKALQDGYREKVHLVTKLPIGQGFVQKEEDFNRILDTQLKRLQTEYLDIYHLHGLGRPSFEKVKQLKIMEKMEQAKTEGKIKHFGFSFHDSVNTFKKIIDYYDWDACQVQFNYMDVDFQAGIEGVRYAAEKGIAVIVMEPLRGGKLFIDEKNLNEKSPDIKEILDESKVKRSLPDWALQYVWNHEEVSVVLSGMSAMNQVEENIESANNSGIGHLTKEELQTTEALKKAFAKHIFAVPCTNCRYCIPCPEGVNIPGLFNILNQFNQYGENTRAGFTSYYKSLPKTQEELEKSGRKNNGSASLCVQCGDCLEKCPQQIEIPDELKSVRAIFEEGKKVTDFY
ncbi:MAG: aldo/keto reductase [Candidatus Lokiarchaeum sp. GC14_75]|nr:MAG: aldo/keto reductase [Candidatus Lokiarchaeum sp. GC14_75]